MRRAGIGAFAAVQLLAGLGMVFAPADVFTDAATRADLRLVLRLAGYTHLAYAGLTAAALVGRDERLARAAAMGHGLYHLLAGVDAARVARGEVPFGLAGPPIAFAALHAAFALSLGLLAVAPRRGAAPPR